MAVSEKNRPSFEWAGIISFAVASEGNLASQLPESGFMGCRRVLEVSVGEIYINAAVVSAVSVPGVVCPVEEVEDLKPELEVDPFRDEGVLVNVDIGLNKVRSAELLWLFVPFLTESGNGEVALRDCTREPSFVVGQLVVTNCIRVIEVVSVAVVVAAAGRVSDSGIQGRAPGFVTQSARLAHCHEPVRVGCGNGITGLEDTRATEPPSAGHLTDNYCPVI